MDFATSTHNTKWILTQAQLEARAAATNAAGVSHVMELRARHAQPTEGLQPLTVDEEAKLVLYYTHMLTNPTVRKLCPHKVTATAVTFMKRFYLHQSAMEFDTLRIALCCLYVAGKACEHYMDAGTISEVVKGMVKAKEILDLETTVLQCLHFDLVVYEPFMCIDAMIQEIRVAAREEDPAVTHMLQAQPEALNMGHKLAYSFADAMLQSSAPLTMRPQQQALVMACVQRTLAEGDGLAEAGHRQVGKEEVVQLDSKVRVFNPLMDTKSELYKELKSSKKKRKRKAGEA